MGFSKERNVSGAVWLMQQQPRRAVQTVHLSLDEIRDLRGEHGERVSVCMCVGEGDAPLQEAGVAGRV